MKLKPMTVTLLVIVLFTSPIWISHLVWRLRPILSLNLLVVNYTVPDDTFRNHKGLFWLLNHRRILGPHQSGIWRTEKDYVGFDPSNTGSAVRLSQINIDQYKWLYIINAYGVYSQDLEKEKMFDSFQADIHGMLFGGLSIDDAIEVSSFVERGGSIILEFNSLTGSTEHSARKIIEPIANVKWSGWSGRFMEQLSEAVDFFPWFKEVYKINYPKASLPSGPGMIFVNENQRMLVLKGQPFEQSAPFLTLTPSGNRWFKGPVGFPPYYDWFSIVEPQKGAEVLAEIVMPYPADWSEQLKNAGLPLTVPLLTRTTINKSNRIFLAANICVADDFPPRHELAGLEKLSAVLHRRKDRLDPGPTYWQFFVPVMGKILSNAAQKSKGAELNVK